MTYTKNKGSNSILLTPKSLSPWEVIFTTKIASNVFLHEYMHILWNKGIAQLDSKSIILKASCKNFQNAW